MPPRTTANHNCDRAKAKGLFPTARVAIVRRLCGPVCHERTYRHVRRRGTLGG
jgi:hypothetical protein